jgi:hypothetical protein
MPAEGRPVTKATASVIVAALNRLFLQRSSDGRGLGIDGDQLIPIPEPVKIDLAALRGGFLPRLEDLVEAQHHRTSTPGMTCLAGSYLDLYRSDRARMRRKTGSVFVTQEPKTNPPTKTAIPATRLLKRLNAPTAATHTKKKTVRSEILVQTLVNSALSPYCCVRLHSWTSNLRFAVAVIVDDDFSSHAPEPTKDVGGEDSDPGTRSHTCESPLCAGCSMSKFVAANHNGDQAGDLGDGSCEECLKGGESGIKRRAALCHGECRPNDDKRKEDVGRAIPARETRKGSPALKCGYMQKFHRHL